MIDYNNCDKCEIKENTLELIWIDSEDFEELKTDNFNLIKFNLAIKKGYSALCEGCYKEECCDKSDICTCDESHEGFMNCIVCSVEDLNYMDDYDDNPIIEGDIREVLDEFNINQSHPLEVDFCVDRHCMGDGKHKVTIGDNEIILYINGSTMRNDFRTDLRDELSILKLNDYNPVEAKAKELKDKLSSLLNGNSPDTKNPNGLIGLIKNEILLFQRDNKNFLGRL